MREILFRGKRIDNGDWIYGNLIIIKRLIGTEYYVSSQNGIDNGKSYRFSVNPTTVGQYTGLIDKNGKKIFEGDILKVHDLIPLFDGYNSEEICYNGKVMYIGNQGMYACEGNGDGNALCALNLDECQVIGNIYDNPELLEVEK